MWLDVVRRHVVELRRNDEPPGRFEALLDDGRRVRADNVLLALGLSHFKHVPPELSALLPPGRWGHTCDVVDLEALRGRRVLIIGGRQSALEWAALLHEEGAAAVHVSHRLATPDFAESDWSWVGLLVDAIMEDPGWYRGLGPAEKESIDHRFWAEGRLTVEPWLARAWITPR